MDALIRTEDLVKEYLLGTHVVQALRGVSVAIEAGEMVAVMGNLASTNGRRWRWEWPHRASSRPAQSVRHASGSKG